MNITLDMVAEVCHEAERTFQRRVGIELTPPWDEAPEEMKEDLIGQVRLTLAGSSPRSLHESWMREKKRDGWTYGEELDEENKKHPHFIPYHHLPHEQLFSNKIFVSIVRSFREPF